MSSLFVTKAIESITLQANAIANLQHFINADFEKAVEVINATKGRVVISGIGKSGIVAQKIVSTLNSTGTAALFMHAADAIHGDLGMIQNDDVVIIISKSGESAEIKVLVPLIKNFGNTLIAICGNVSSYLATNASIILNTTVDVEACPNNLAPTTSTTAQMVMGDAMAIALMHIKGFASADFAKYHPGGNLGKRLYLRVDDLYNKQQAPKVLTTASLQEVIVEITTKRLGATAVVSTENDICGIITDGDLRRMLEKNNFNNAIVAQEILTSNPKTISAETLAVEALDIIRQNDISQLVVADGIKYLGILHLHDLVREGIV